MLTESRLKELLSYDPETGVFIWLARPSPLSRAKVGGVAGSSLAHGYLQVKIEGQQYLQHRLAFLYMTGRMPVEVDHINLNKSDNRWSNLREATTSLNHGNLKLGKRNTSGFKGAFWHSSKLRWYSSITQHGHSKHLGCFDSPEAAHDAYVVAAIKFFGKFARAS